MNIYLIPHTWMRHVAIALVSGGAALLTWWYLLAWLVVFGPWLHEHGMLFVQAKEGAWFLALTAGVLAFVNIFAEGALYRKTLLRRVGLSLLSGFIAWLTTLIAYAMAGLVVWLLMSDEMSALAEDGSLITLRYRWMQWVAAGLCSALGPLIVRRGRGFFNHVFGGLVAAAVAGAVWHWIGYNLVGDYYLASACAWFAWGTLHGLLIWAVPDELYAGWLRVLSEHRYGYRIPVDRIDGMPSERFVGHFPRGLDLFLPVDQGVAELHTSVLVDDEHNYAIRGLSQRPTLIKRFLESIDLRYDPSRPAPLQTELQQEDRIVLSDGNAETVFEFVLLPKEER